MVSESVSVDFEIRKTESNTHKEEMNSEKAPVERTALKKSKKKKQKKNKVSPDSADIAKEIPGDETESPRKAKKKRRECNADGGSPERSFSGEREGSEEIGEKKKRKKKDATDWKTVLEKQTKTSSNEMDTDEGREGGEKKSKGPSKRQLKREKAEQREAEKRIESKKGAVQKGLNYVSTWKHARESWKFEKLRQIWLMDHLLSEESIPDSLFPTVLEYFEGSKGMARQQLLEKGMAVIAKVEAEEDEERRDELTESTAYKRARQLLQALPAETQM